MTEEVTLAQLAAEITQLRQQINLINQRLDMIYGAVTRLADQSTPSKSTASSQSNAEPQAGPKLSATAMMDPGSMLDALRQYAVESGLDIPQEMTERLKEDIPTESTADEN
jgi:hypothetical protein